MGIYTAPTTWTAGQTVSAADLNAQIRDNLFHIAGSVGFTATPSTSVGIQPSAGYFAGATLRNYHLEGGNGACTSGAAGTIFSFSNAYEAAPVVLMSIWSSSGRVGDNTTVSLIAVSSSGFTAIINNYSSALKIQWMAWGSDT